MNHPVHILDNDGKLSQSALIPFCQIGDDMNATGVLIDEFNIPVCNKFEKIIRIDQVFIITLSSFLMK